jgi:hypothetical protein
MDAALPPGLLVAADEVVAQLARGVPLALRASPLSAVYY